MTRKTTLKFYFVAIVLLYALIFTLLSWHKNNFSLSGLDHMIYDTSPSREITTDACKSGLMGDPGVGADYVKINIWCATGKDVRSTLALKGIRDKTVPGAVREYSRIVALNSNVLQGSSWTCLLNDQILPSNTALPSPSKIDCYHKDYPLKKPSVLR